MLKGVPLADAFLTIASIDPCFSCTERFIVLKDLRNNEVKTLSLIDGRKYILKAST
jgi:Ni,Fe-hydrogenase III large subunit